MRRVEYQRYGEADVLYLGDATQPVITRPNQVLVKVVASSINAIDWKNRQGRFRLVSGWWRPRVRQGFDVAGIVLSTGGRVKALVPGDVVIGLLNNFSGGAFAEQVVVAENQLARVEGVTDFNALAGLPMAASTAWLALLKNGGLKPGYRVLINGGSSGVGSYAIQIAKAYGASVTVVCSSANTELCKTLGAETVIDYTQEDFVKSGVRYHVVFDVVNNRSLQEVKPILTEGGRYVGTTPLPRLLWEMLCSRQARFVAVKPDPEILKDIVRLYSDQKLRTVIDRIFSLADIVEAHRYSQQSRTRGKVIIKVSEDSRDC